MICQTIRHIAKDADVQSVRQFDGRNGAPTREEVVTTRRSRQRIAHVGGAYGDVVTASCERVRERVHNARNAPVRPGVGEIRRDMQDAEWRH